MTSALKTATDALPFDDVWLPLERADQPLTIDICPGEVALDAVARFDYEPGSKEAFAPWVRPPLPERWNVGVVVGVSGSGKSTMLKDFGAPAAPVWDANGCIVDHFPNADEATKVLYAVGLSSVPTWLKPYRVLSVGEKFRADLARVLVSDDVVVDEFTSTVDRTVARAASVTVGKWVRANNRRVAIATVHRDVLPWLQPDWVIDLDAGVYALRPRECLQRPEMVAQIFEVDHAMWRHFMGHHYLSADISSAARCFAAIINGEPAAFAAAVAFPNGNIINGWRETRLVTLPEYQGLGVGPRLSDWVAEAHTRAGCVYYSKTTHPRLGEWRQRSQSWVPTETNLKQPKTAPVSTFGKTTKNAWVGSMRLSYSHKWVTNHRPTGPDGQVKGK